MRFLAPCLAAVLALCPGAALADVSPTPQFELLPGGDTLHRPAAQKPSPAVQAYVGAVNALAGGDLATAETQFKVAITDDPKMPEPLLGLAEIAMRRQDPRGAEQYLHDALVLGPNRSDIHVAWAKFLLRENRVQEAKTSLEAAISFDKSNPRPLVDLGDLYLEVLKNPDKAISLYQNALAVAPQNPTVLLALGRGLERKGQLADARALFEHAARVAPKNPLPVVAIADVIAQSGRSTDALMMYDRALRIGDVPAAHLSKATLLLRLGRREDAANEYGLVLEANPESEIALVSLGMLELQLNRPHEAMRHLQRAMAIDPHVPDVLNTVAWQGAAAHKNLDEAVLYAQTAVALAPNAVIYRDTLGWVYLAKGNLPRAVSELKAAAAPGNDPEILTHLAVAYAESGDRPGASRALGRALSLKAGYAPALQAKRSLHL